MGVNSQYVTLNSNFQTRKTIFHCLQFSEILRIIQKQLSDLITFRFLKETFTYYAKFMKSVFNNVRLGNMFYLAVLWAFWLQNYMNALLRNFTARYISSDPHRTSSDFRRSHNEAIQGSPDLIRMNNCNMREKMRLFTIYWMIESPLTVPKAENSYLDAYTPSAVKRYIIYNYTFSRVLNTCNMNYYAANWRWKWLRRKWNEIIV